VPNELVSLYRCKLCGVRMFIERTGRHIEQFHPTERVDELFEAGPKEVFRRPGGNMDGMGHAKPGRGRSPKEED
jgi:hypothetical protein